MATRKHSATVAHTYARSVLALANEQQQAEALGQELRELKEVLESHPDLTEFLSNPGVGIAERQALLERVFKGKVAPLMMNLLGVLNQKGRLGMLPQLADAYDGLLDEQFGKIEVDVTVARRLNDEELEQVRRRVSESLGKDAVIHQYVDESIIGGLILRVQDKLIDSSVRAQLRSIRRQLLASRPKHAAGLFAAAGSDGQASA